MNKQNHIVEEMKNVAKRMRVCERKSVYQFQKGLIISCNSLSKLYEMLKAKYNVSYILTYRLNQDGLQHMFGCIRQMGIFKMKFTFELV